MTTPSLFYSTLKKNKIDFFVGVPDSLLKNFLYYISNKVNKKNHIIAANEGTAVAIAAGYNIAKKKIPFVYLQNSGLGNLINPILSMTDKKVYQIPMLVMIGWRGEPNIKDEPQHKTQGEVTIKLIQSIKKKVLILDGREKSDIKKITQAIEVSKKNSEPVFLLVRKNTFTNLVPIYKDTKNNFKLRRQDAIKEILKNLKSNYKIVASTGMISRELYEIREENKDSHVNDFLVVGSMGHASQIALGIATQTKKKIICIDGDGALLMHLGGLTTIGSLKIKNYIHIVLNNEAHDSVGGQPTAANNINICKIAEGCGYKNVFGSLKKISQIKHYLKKCIHSQGPSFIEINVQKGHKKNLGRPKKSPLNSKLAFLKKFNS